MKKMVVVWTVVVCLLVGLLLFIGYNFIKSEEGYKTLENDLIEASSIYIKKDINVSVNEEVKIKAKELLDKGYVTSLKVLEDTCNGYVKVKRKINKYEYKVYIKCQNYETLE